MGCGCNKKKRVAQAATSYTLTMPDGSTSDHGSRLEAQAANVQHGGGGKVKASAR
jgi:hypothetical protein